MAVAYRCKDGDMLDAICQHYYGGTAGMVEQVLEANPGLAGKGPTLPAGTLVVLPDLPQAQEDAGTVELW